jgi:nicotinate-nucleotide pyrophosphorylase
MKIKYKRLPEANIQAEIYHVCKKNGIGCLLEYKIDNCRFDVVLFDTGTQEIYAIIEVKSFKYHTNKAWSGNEDTKQMRKYKTYGLPVYIIGRMEHVSKTVKMIVDKNKLS